MAESPANSPFQAPKGHIALILPTSSSAYADAATAVREGFMTGFRANSLPNEAQPIAYYATDGMPSTVTSVYQQAIHEGAKFIVGPLARDEVSALFRGNSISIQTLALNHPDGGAFSPLLYTFGIKTEEEIHQLRELLKKEGKHKIAVVSTRSPFFLKLANLFAEQWQDKAGGREILSLHVSPNAKELSRMHSNFPLDGVDAIFLAASAPDACLIRPFLAAGTPIYTTSHAYEGGGAAHLCPDLRGVHFLEMPYVLLKAQGGNSDTVQVSALHQRFYALGVDAFLVADGLFHGTLEARAVLDGATGEISKSGNNFTHKLIPAEFGEDGNVHPTKFKSSPSTGLSHNQAVSAPRETPQ